MSSWTTSKSLPQRRGNLSFKSGQLTVEFDRTKYSKVFSHYVGRVVFNSGRDINTSRQDLIDPSSSSVYLNQSLILESNNGSYTVLAHGTPVGSNGKENCASVSMNCSSGQGTDRLCNRGKCISGTLSRVTETRSDGSERISPYKWAFVSPKESYFTLQENGVIKLRHNRLGSSRFSYFYVPPNSYLGDEGFVRQVFKTFSYFTLIGNEDSKEKFVSEGLKQSSYYTPGSVTVKDLLLQDISGLIEPWYSLAEIEINASRELKVYDKDFLADIYDRLSLLFSKAIQVTPSSFNNSSISYLTTELARPVYSRLPGTSGGYSSIDNEETVSKWVVSGVDEFLTLSRSRISNFYRDYLDPDTCYPAALDWLAQHIGMFGPLWDVTWEPDIKRCLIKNAFGWWDKEVDGINHKSKVLKEFPFVESSLWSDQPVQQGNLKLNEIERFTVDSNSSTISLSGKYAIGIVNNDEVTGISTESRDYINNPAFYSSDWNGLMESKGGLLSVVFLVSLFGLKGHTPEELEIIDLERGMFRPRSGLRELEIDAPPLLPFKNEFLQVGDYADLRTNNFKNQLVVGLSRVSDPETTKNIIFRVPFYYNRNGKSWSKVEYIVKNWMPADVNARVQYPYLSADLWQVGDAFFEPDYEVS